ncbi:MAG: RluA family pseudouridine synthase [Christensenellales bacterium]|jgi:23S rRNA pseudouridine1911/1915/1917 synthase
MLQGIDILYEDNHVLVAVKPPFMPVQADPSGDPDMLSILKEYVRVKYNKPGEAYLGLVHRLDRPVGGALVFARTSKAAARLSKSLQTRDMRRAYLAVIQGRMAAAEGQLVDHLIKNTRTNMVSVVSPDAPGAKKAVLHYWALAQGERDGQPISLVMIQLGTGRGHQIRVQMAHCGHPLVGDMRYGGRQKPGTPIALWAAGLSFTHPTRREERLRYIAPPPAREPFDRFDIAGLDLGNRLPV